MRKWARACILQISLLITACSSQMIRPDDAECSADYGFCKKSYKLVNFSPSYSLSFVEFDDQGHVFSREKLNSVIQFIENKGDEQDIILYIHGWKHNAKYNDSNVKAFQGILERTATRYQKYYPTRKVTGVYLGWTGDAIPIGIINNISFWDRKNVSMDIGLGGVRELLTRLEHISANKKKTRMIAIGHSFGGSVLFSATKNKIYSELVEESLSQKKLIKEESAFQDLYILVNPAIENIQYAPLHFYVEEMVSTKNHANVFLSKKFPTLAVFISKNDLATKWSFPLGRFWSTLFENHNEVRRTNRFGEKQQYSQWSMDIKALGHYEDFITHELVSISDSRESKNYCKDAEVIGKTFPVNGSNAGKYTDKNEGWKIPFVASKTSLKHLKNSPAFSPLWVVSVDESIIKNHNDIFGAQFNCFIEELMVIDKT